MVKRTSFSHCAILGLSAFAAQEQFVQSQTAFHEIGMHPAAAEMLGRVGAARFRAGVLLGVETEGRRAFGAEALLHDA